jgi:RimJ/RimL family protein N-acetyltransferase
MGENRSMLTLRAMELADLDLVEMWLRDAHVARWYLAGTAIEDELEDLRQCVLGAQRTHPLVVAGEGRAIGWCQWYLCSDYPDHAAGVQARPGDIGLDYAIGDPMSTGRGLGTALIAALVAYIRGHHPQAGLIADPEASNVASRTVLEKNGFRLVQERPVASEGTDATMAIYRLAAGPATERMPEH